MTPILNPRQARRLVTVVSCLAISVIMVSCGSNRKSTSGQPPGGEPAIAYNIAVKDAAGKSNYEVFSMNLDGSGNKNITNHPDVAWTYEAFKKDLYFISDRDTCYRCYFLYKTDVNGSHVKKVSDLQLEDSWMDFNADGSQLAVTGRIGKEIRAQLFIINPVTGTYRQVTHDTAAYFRDPVFSPDGKQVALVYRKNKRDRTLKDDVYLMDLGNGSLKQLTQYPKEKIKDMIPGYTAGALRWHPKENFITYISYQDGRHHIYMVTPDGKKQGRLTANQMTEGWHDWSPDGQWLVFDSSNDQETQYHIMLMNWKTKEIRQLTGAVHQYQQCPVFVER